MREIEERPGSSGDGSLSARSATPSHIALLGNRSLCSACLKALLRECDDAFTMDDVRSASDVRRENAADVALLPLLNPQPGMLAEVARMIRTLDPVPLVLLVDRGDPHIVDQVVGLGARGVLTLDADIRIVAAALRLVIAGGIYIPASPARHAALTPTAPRHAGEAEGDRLDRLSPRERAVLDLLRQSLSNREIAGKLGIAEATVKIHIRNLLRKTNARNRVELALLSARGT